MKKISAFKILQWVLASLTLGLVFIFFIAFDNDKNVFVTQSFLNKEQNELTLKAALSNESRKMPLYGFNGNNTRGPSFAEKPFLDSVASLQLKIIRYPGGTSANWWNWQKGWYVDNPNLPNSFKRMNYSPSGLLELKSLINKTNCDVVFCLNITTSTLQDQIAMLKYAQSLNIPVKWVELGNELNNQKNFDRQKFPTVADFGKICEQWIDAIKVQFPSAKVAVVGGNRNYSDGKNWNDIVLKNAPNADAIVAHLYPKKQDILDDSGINFQKLFEQFVDEFNSQGFNTINNTSIWITEYNIQWAHDNENKESESKAYTWSQALATLLMTSMASSLYPNTPLILNHNISNTSVFAAIETEKRSLRKLPNGIGMAGWLSASNNMDVLTKINFTDDNNQTKQDYQLFGWKFTNNKNASVLFVNLQGSTVKINISNLIHGDASFDTKYDDKNLIINSAADVNSKKGTVNNSLIELPAYSFTIIKANQ